MKKYHAYQNNSTAGDPVRQDFSRASIQWDKSEEEAWSELSLRLKEKDQELRPAFSPGRKWFAMAASITLLLALGGFLRFHSIEIATLEGETLSVDLPDGSLVELNTNSRLSYHPYLWKISRRAELEGEAWFEVEKGSRFRVLSSLATTEVLGTSFNVLSRDKSYHVSCFSGRVQVSAQHTGDKSVLDPGKQVKLKQDGSLELSEMEFMGNTPKWLNQNIMFSSTPLSMVFEEIEKQFSIKIDASGIQDLIYSGNFPTNIPLENVLTLLCRPFNLSYEKITDKKYIIYPEKN